ncbi:MAG TPA: LPS export ABC transporter permease LptF [Ottowia sp.]|uniref:LPS export ABC transporter permease LptF n=1 Tax=Ottowia sp. TaxID=1898956 RepID=UPI002BF63229|nr:LPS export ABC transporter permease LptF [Ottowia sp.]HMN20506.1 LPS export ABC transporter permease LptF [Ottowia sp.]
MLFDSALRKELGRSFGATLVVLITIVMTVLLIRTLGQASAGRVNPSEVMLVMGFTVLGHLPTILTLSLFVAITATLTRMYASSEMVVWFSCGQGLSAFVRPLLRFAWPVLLAVVVLALLVWPWSHQQIRELRDRYQARGDIERVAPGRFIESASGQRVFFIDKDTADAYSGSNIFIATSDGGVESVVSAQSGRVVTRDAERFLELEHGSRLEVNRTQGTLRMTEFAQYSNRIDASIPTRVRSDSPSLASTFELLLEPTPRNQAELSWRLGLALAGFNCVLIALAATRVNPRVGRSAGLVFALFAFTTYYNLIGAGQNWIARQRLGLGAYLLLLHGGICLAALVWLYWRQRNWRVRRGNRPAVTP